MDPQATWTQLVDAYTSHDWEAVLDAAEALQYWLSRHGFPPETVPGKRVGCDWNMVVVQAVCEFTRNLAERVLADPNRIPADVAFSLSCCDCDTPGPSSFEAAVQEGWTLIEFAPEAVAENYFGLCPEHSQQEE
jgi:hypothetical protein